MDPDFHAAVLQSIEKVSRSSDRFRVPELYKSAIGKWRRPGQQPDRVKACDGLYLWYLAEPGFAVSDRDFKRCPDSWKDATWLTNAAPSRVVTDTHYMEQFVAACDSLFAKLTYESEQLPGPTHFADCPKDWREKYYGESDGDYQSLVKFAPKIPAIARRRCQNGWVTVRYDIATDGRKENVEVI